MAPTSPDKRKDRPAPPKISHRHSEEAHSGSWKVAYADFVTAMMAFFLLMWIMNMVPPEKKEALSNIFQGKVNFEGSTSSIITNNPLVTATDKLDTRNLKLSKEQITNLNIAMKLRQMVMDDPVLQSSSGISSDDVGVLLRVNNDIMFKSGSAALTPEAMRAIDMVVNILRDYNLFLVVRGHSDSDEVTSQVYPSNWELSGARASAAVRYIVSKESRILPNRLRAVAYADTRPLVPNTTPQNKIMNRRIEFYFHRPEVMSYQVVY